MTTTYESRLRAKLAEAEAAHASAVAELNATDAHPMSQEYKGHQWSALIAAGRLAGLTEAEQLLTGDSPRS